MWPVAYLIGWIVSIVTFPGQIMHTVAQRMAFDLLRIPVYEVRYYRNPLHPSGYIVHAPINQFREAFLVWMAPVVLNTLLCAAITFPAVFPVFFLDEGIGGLVFILLWCGLSIGMHAFPKSKEAAQLFDHLENPPGFVFRCFRGFVALINFLQIAWLDLFYG